MTTSELTDDEVGLLLAVVELARAGKTEELERAIAAGYPVNLTNAAGDSLLILAAYHVHTETVAMLLAHGADTERMNDRGQTALGAATFRQDDRAVAALLAAGADPGGGARSAVQIAEFFGLTRMVRLLTGRRPGATTEHGEFADRALSETTIDRATGPTKGEHTIDDDSLDTDTQRETEGPGDGGADGTPGQHDGGADGGADSATEVPTSDDTEAPAHGGADGADGADGEHDGGAS